MDTIFKILLVFIFLFKLIKSEVLVDEHNYRYEKIADQVIYKKRNVYACFPKLYKLKDTLVIRFSARTLRSHYDKSGGVIELISIDNGQTWQMSNNKVLFFPGYKNNKNEYVTIGPKGWQKVKKREVERYKSNGVIIKETSGQYWQATGVVVTTNNNKGEIINTRSPVLPKHAFLMGYNLSSYLKFGNGMRLLGLYGRILKDDKQDQVFIMRSSDDGITWDFNAMYSSNIISTKIGLNETAFVEGINGQIFSMIRSTDGYLYSSISYDEGENWTLPKKTSIWGYPANLIKINDSSILCTYGYRKEPMGIRAIVLDNNSYQPISQEFIIRSDAERNPGDNGYPMTVQLTETTFFTCYYISLEDGITHIAGTKWELSESY